MKKRYIFLAIVLLLAGALAYLGRSTASPDRKINWGVTFKDEFMKEFGIDWRPAFLAIMDNLKIKKIRLIAHWMEIEIVENQFDFSNLDWQVEQAGGRGVKIILAVGMKEPRWPECHNPSWAKDRSDALLKYIETTVNRYKNNPAISVWEVENEPFLSFGECPPFNVSLLDEEIALVKKLDSRPVMITDSGELSFWVRAAKRSDIFGTTMYRWVWNQYLGSYEYPIPPAFFRLKERLTRLFVGQNKPFVVIELQAEPWTHKQIYEISIDEQLKLMPLSEIKATIDYAKQTGFSDYYLWGVEWWYYLRQNNHPEYWDYFKGLVQASSLR